MAIKYKRGGLSLPLGNAQVVSLPSGVFRGRATCMHFDTDKSFLLPPSVPGVRNIVAFFQRHPGANMLVNGHTDLVGDAQHNLQLSNERAAAVAAYLLNSVDDWLARYDAGIASKRWSFTEDQQMLQTVEDASGAPYYAGSISGVNDAATQDAARRFQADNGLNPDGQLGPQTRRALIGKYMALEGTSLPPGTPLVLHGCGEFHPIDPTAGADQGNRRVEIFLFEGPIAPPPQDPCPAPGCTQYLAWVGNPDEDVDLCKPQKFDLRVLVQDDATPPHAIAGAQVNISASGVAPITVDEQGTGTFFDLPPGSYQLTASHAGLPSRTQPVTVPGPSSGPDASTSSALAGEGAPPSPPPPPPNTTTATVTLPAQKLDLIINWGDPSTALQARHLAAASPVVEGTAGASFWLTGTAPAAPSAGAATLGVVAAADLPAWTTATPAPVPLTLQASKLEARGQVAINPSANVNLRLDFDLQVTIGSTTKSVLRFKQLLAMDTNGQITASKYLLDSYKLVPVAASAQAGKEGLTPPVRTADPPREIAGSHPLVTLNATSGASKAEKIVVDAQFVDATELWWGTHAAADLRRWYLHPDLGGRQDNLRVLAWTTGGAPMIWFVAVTDAAAKSIAPAGGAPAADIIFFRPPAGVNSFFYGESAKGFSAARHQDTTLYILARYLLAPVPIATALGAAGVKDPALLADQIQPTNFSLVPPDPNALATVGGQPKDPMDLADNVFPAFVPTGLERAIARAGQPHVLFLPLGWDAFVHLDAQNRPDPKPGDRPGGGYHAATLAKMKDSLARATMVLWNTGAVARGATATPDASARKLWAAGHSAGNFTLVTHVQNNAADVDRIISVDASGGPLASLKNVISKAVQTRGAVEAFVISSPNLLSTPRITKQGSQVVKVDFDSVKASDFKDPVVLLPDLGAEPAYWQTVPVASMNGYLHHLLGLWRDADIAASASDPSRQRPPGSRLNWLFLFFHEYAVYGGHLEGASVTRTFFEDALGPTTFGSLVVQTVSKLNGQPIAGATVTATVGPFVRRGLTDVNGKVTLTSLLPGSYTIEGEAFEAGPNSVTAAVAAGNANAPVTLQLVFSPSTI